MDRLVKIPVRLIVGGKAEAAEKSKNSPGVLVCAVRRYLNSGRGGWTLAHGCSAAFDGEGFTVGGRALDLLCLLGVQGSATNRDIGDAITAYRVDGGTIHPTLGAHQVRVAVAAKLKRFGLALEEFHGVDPQRRRYRLCRLDNMGGVSLCPTARSYTRKKAIDRVSI